MKTIIYDHASNAKPLVQLAVQRVEANVWTNLNFHKSHYLTPSLNKSAKCLLFTWNEVPVAFVALLNSPRKGHPNGYSISRIVIQPDYQGFGLFSRIMNFCGGIIKNQGDDYDLYIKTIHEKAGYWLEHSPNWSPTSYNGKTRSDGSTTRYKNRLTRQSYCFKYVGEKIDGYSHLLKPIKELRENVNNNSKN